MDHTNPTMNAMRRYYWELGLSLAAYVALILISRSILRHTEMTLGAGQIALALLPLIPVIFIFAAIVRFVMHTDELQRQIIVHSLALAGGVTVLSAVTYGLLEGDILPPPSAWWTYTLFMTSWIVAGLFVRRHYR